MSFLYQNAAFLSNLKHLRRRLCVAGIIVPVGFGMLQAQEVPDGARQIILDVGQRLEWSDNPDLEEEGEDRFTSRTTLQFTGFRRSRSDILSFSLGGDFELSDGDEDVDNGIANPNLGLAWARDVGHAQTGISFDYREADLGSTTGTFFNEDTDSIDFGTVDRGTRQTADLRLNGAFGIESPVGGSYDLWQRQIRYSDTDDEDLRDADRLTFDAGVFVVAGPRVTLGLEGFYSDFDEVGPGDLDTVETRLDSFADITFSQRLSGRFALGWEEVEESGTSNNVEDGVVFEADLTQALQRSEISFGVASDIVASGRRSEVRFGQSFDLPRNELSYSLGLSRLEDEDTEPLIGFAWSQDLPRGGVRALIEQTATTSRDNENLINSRMALGYTHELTARSGVDLEFAFIDRNDRSTEDDDSQRFDINLTYRHTLYQDWNLVSGISLVRLEEDDGEDTDANTIFVGLEKRFVWN